MSDRPSFGNLGVHVGPGGRVTCHTYPHDTPILAVDADRIEITFSIAGREATDAAVKFARQLAEQAARFAEDVERVHAEQSARSSGVCAGCGGPVPEAA
ncbi:MAG TPA: hypothetical protein VGG75_02905 [Trebonia sp.]|jgi:hypothetical protein